MFDINAVEKKAAEEIRKERETAAVKELKTLMGQIAASKLVTRNLERELEVLKAEIGDRA